MTLDELATLIIDTIKDNTYNTKGEARGAISNHAAILKVLVLASERRERAWNIERAKLLHRIRELEGV
jgi:hypothetical protein